MSESTVQLLQGAADEIRRARALLQSHGIKAHLGEPPEGCGNSWGTKLALAVASEDAPSSIQILNADWGGELSPEVLERAGKAIDLEAETAACPACGGELQPSSGRCPDCGLRLF